MQRSHRRTERGRRQIAQRSARFVAFVCRMGEITAIDVVARPYCSSPTASGRWSLRP
ncbi:hypothetical protein BSLA_02r0274 [Burkholderia stabilis]|nr:hypothetical protein BSLA_02r0274 [Burkholderia stabilis]